MNHQPPQLPQGYRYATVYARIRKVKKDDVALIVSDQPASAAAVFTTNVVKAAPVLLAQRHLKAAGIFARLNHRDGKPDYLNDIPRTLSYVCDVAGRYTELNPFKDLLLSINPSLTVNSNIK